MHLQLVTAIATAPGAAGTAAAAVSGDSLTILNGKEGSKIRCVALWARLQAAGFIQVANYSGHDLVRGLRTRVALQQQTIENPLGIDWLFRAQETLAVTLAGSATAGDIETACMLFHYENMPGIDARLMSWDAVRKRASRLTTVEATITSAAGGGYTGAELLNSESDLLQANTDYAVLGLSTSVNVAAVWLSGPDTGNVRVGVPGVVDDHDISANFFSLISRAYDIEAIPIINSGNKASTNIGVATDENAGSIPVTVHLAMLT
jgi:hypothetical protein